MRISAPSPHYSSIEKQRFQEATAAALAVLGEEALKALTLTIEAKIQFVQQHGEKPLIQLAELSRAATRRAQFTLIKPPRKTS